MEVLLPIRFDGYMQSGGSTKPWKVSAIQPNAHPLEERSLVVKLFTPKQVSQGNSIGKEFICNALAGQFDFEVPFAFLIDLNNDDFRSTLDQEVIENLNSKYKGLTFASTLVDATLINESLKYNSFNMHDRATLFAFDCLILNLDRGGYRNKPNLLVDDDGFILIDHELTFNFIDRENDLSFNKIINDFKANTWPWFYQKHIFYSNLKNYRGAKKNLFDTFEESLRTININSILELVDELEGHQVEMGNTQLLIDYLKYLKQNSTQFRNILLGLIA